MKYKIGNALITIPLLLSMLAAGCGNLTNTLTTPTNNSVSPATNDLSLSLSTNSTTYRPGQDVSITVDIKNMWQETNHIIAAKDWPYDNLEIDQCDMGPWGFVYPYGIAIFQGSYSLSDFAAATPLALYDFSLLVPCPAPIPAASYDFQPLSDIAQVSGSSAQFPTSTFAITTTLAETGYWSGSTPKVTKHNFEPGVYTIVAGDEWGNLVILHFTVTNS